MKCFRVARAGLFAVLLASGTQPVMAEEDLTPGQEKAVRELVREILRENPEIVVEAIQAWQERQKAEEERQLKATIAELRDALENDPTSPIIGNPEGDVTIVEFMDYRCGYCKQVFPAIQALLEEDGGIRYVLKEFPILGPDSEVAARAALVVWELAPESYMEFHTALMSARGGLNEKRVLGMVADLGLDADRVRGLMQSPKITEIIQSNMAIAQGINIRGTPAFVIGGRLIPGAVSAEVLRELVAEARAQG